MRKKLISILIIALCFALLASCARKDKENTMDTKIMARSAVTPVEHLLTKVCPADDALALAKAADVVVFEFKGCTSGQEVWDAFYQKVSNNEPATVLCAYYYTLDPSNMSAELYEQEKDKYPVLYLYDIVYNGEQFTVTIRDSSKADYESKETYKHIIHSTGEAPDTALYRNYDYYILVDDPELTWEQIEGWLFSSQWMEQPKYCTVYSNYEGWID